MDTRRLSVAALLLLAGALLLGAPVYAGDDAGRTPDIVAEPADPGEDLAATSRAVADVDSLPAVARVAVERAVARGTFATPTDGLSLFGRLMAEQWAFVARASDDTFYRTAVERSGGSVSLRLEPVDAETVRREVRIAVEASLDARSVAEQAEDVVLIGAFDEQRRQQLEIITAGRRLFLENGTDAGAVAPVGDRVQFVRSDGRFYRIGVEERGGRVVVTSAPADLGAVLAATDTAVVAVGNLSGALREAVERAVADPGQVVSAPPAATAPERFDRVQGNLIAVDGYYRIRRHYAPDEPTHLLRGSVTVGGFLLVVAGAWLLAATPRTRGS